MKSPRLLASIATLFLVIGLYGCSKDLLKPNVPDAAQQDQSKDEAKETPPWARHLHDQNADAEKNTEEDASKGTAGNHAATPPPTDNTADGSAPTPPSRGNPGGAATIRPHVSAPNSFADLVAQVEPAVVNVYTEQVIPHRYTRVSPLYGRYEVTRPAREMSLGSGFIIDADGYILTNTHVIKGAQSVRVVTTDGKKRQATIIGADPMTDIALLKIDPYPGMRVLKLGDAHTVRVGDWLMAVGNPFGLQSTVTTGILSARGRRNVRIKGDVRYIDFLQTDASINPGNSGGPLIAMDGTVIGINTAINANGQGIGFAIPINMARYVLKDLRKGQPVERSWLGVTLSPMPADSTGNRPQGAYIRTVVARGPADQAGIKPGDIITQFGEHEITSFQDLPWVASTAGVGSTVEVQIQRGDQTLDLPVTMGTLPY